LLLFQAGTSGSGAQRLQFCAPPFWWQAEEMSFEYLMAPFHCGEVAGVDTCLRRPLVATAGADRTIRLWNTVSRTADLVKARRSLIPTT
jgi:hypothetical protein